MLTAVEERAGRLRRSERDHLLARMSDEVAALVLRNNYLQGQAISTLELQSARRISELQHLIRVLERAGELNRAVEQLPDDSEEIAERRKRWLGLTRPELAVMLAYSKIVLNEQLIASDVPSDPREVGALLPGTRAATLRARDPLHRREIIATATTNGLVNRMGPTFVMRAQEDTSASPSQVARAPPWRPRHSACAHAGSRSGARQPSAGERAVRDEPRDQPPAAPRELLAAAPPAARARDRCHRAPARLKRSTSWSRPSVRCCAAATAERYRESLATHLKEQVPAPARRLHGGDRSARLRVDVVELAHLPVRDAAAVYFEAGARIGLDWLRAEIDRLQVEGTWQAIAQRAARCRAIDPARDRHACWRAAAVAAREAQVAAGWPPRARNSPSWQRTLADMRAAGGADFATLSVGVDAVRKLAGA
ncbi:MAG: NAD-glutamate dehydrogenase [Steroidobacteraceae bacterium]